MPTRFSGPCWPIPFFAPLEDHNLLSPDHPPTTVKTRGGRQSLILVLAVLAVFAIAKVEQPLTAAIGLLMSSPMETEGK